MDTDVKIQLGNKLIRYGILLFLAGLITGFVIPAMENPRMGLSSHLEGTLNGMLLILLGVIWPKLKLTTKPLNWAYRLSLFGTFTNWATTFLAGLWGAGSEIMPFAGNKMQGALWQEVLIKAGLISLSLAMVSVCLILLWGMRGKVNEN